MTIVPWRENWVYKLSNGEIIAIYHDITERRRGEMALRESEEFNRNLVNNLPDYILIYDQQGIILFTNPSFLKIFGFTTEEAIGSSILDHIAYEHRNNIGNLMMQRFSNQVIPPYELSILKKDGSPVPVIVKGAPIRYKDRDAALVLMNDISAQKRAEEVIRNLNAYNRGLIEASIDPLITIDHVGKISDVNRATELVTGYPRETLIGTDFTDYFTEPAKAKEGYNQAFSEGKVFDYPLAIRHCDGHITPVLYNATVFHDPEGKVRGVFAAARDISKWRQTEEALRESEERFHIIADIDPVPVSIAAQSDGTILFTNPAYNKAFGIREGESIGHKTPDLYYNQRDRELLMRTLKEQGFVDDTEIQVKRKDGTPFWVSVSLRPLTFSGKAANLATSLDITDRKTMDHQREALLKELEQKNVELESLLI